MARLRSFAVAWIGTEKPLDGKTDLSVTGINSEREAVRELLHLWGGGIDGGLKPRAVFIWEAAVFACLQELVPSMIRY